MCHEGVIWSSEEASQSLCNPILTAARLGICEIVREILKACFYSYTFGNENRHAIFHLAILHRQEKVFNLVNKMDSFLWEWKAANRYERTNNILHLTARLVISSQVSGAALQMQRELQRFKSVENYVHPSLQEQRNGYGKTPREVFTKEHEKLVEKGEKWMKDTASSCSIVAALIITVVFAAAFTVPGGNKENGTPIFLQSIAFIVFAVSDALALFSSISSVLMFLAILTSRYSEDDFLESLPKKLMVGLITLVIWSRAEAKPLHTPVLTAATLGIYELVNEIMKAYFFSFVFAKNDDDDILRLAILNRHEKVFVIDPVHLTELAIRNGDEITEMKQGGDPRYQTANLQSHENDESMNAEGALIGM
ncbi:ankyrin repeat-containing protein At5g02620-like [Pistacia vera]|uniref:ankyrin repeat-containing protein At5g02620-like n=1 Tax=Pistacia vera TaxID=55513 RepID=UPI001263750A|nr:ankyrin repeat-containing protein At5g02620-like [Pistacia vera]